MAIPLNFLLLTVVSKSSYGPIACLILLRTLSFVMCSVYDMLRSLVASHLHCLYSALKVGGEGPGFVCIQDDQYHEIAHQTDL